MPMLDAYIPQGALSPESERALLGELTDLLLRHEGADPADERTRSIAWVFVHRPEVYVAGAAADAPRYRFICQVPEGQYNDERRAAVEVAGAWVSRSGAARRRPRARRARHSGERRRRWASPPPRSRASAATRARVCRATAARARRSRRSGARAARRARRAGPRCAANAP